MEYNKDIIDRINLLNDSNKKIYSEILNKKCTFIE